LVLPLPAAGLCLISRQPALATHLAAEDSESQEIARDVGGAGLSRLSILGICACRAETFT
jgi:2-oxo-4-hydroxy-4-carboxy--5-ureidoimidazoline (OHCU) decarboxylase